MRSTRIGIQDVMCLILNKPIRFEPHISVNVPGKLLPYFSLLLTPPRQVTALLSIFRGNFVLAKVHWGLISVRCSELRGVHFTEVLNLLVLR